MSTDIVIYSSNLCPFCYRAKALLKQKGLKYKEIIVDLNPSVRNEMRQKSGGRNTVPQIFFNGEHVGGCDDLYALSNDGGLTTYMTQAV